MIVRNIDHMGDLMYNRFMNKSAVKIISRVGRDFADFIVSMGEFYETIVLTPYGQLRMRRPIPRSTYYDKVDRFKKAKLIVKKPGSNNNIFVLTPKGRAICKTATKKENRKDGLATLILFDIPVKFNRERTIFRRFLIKNGYILAQKSSFLGPWKLTSDIKQLAKELKIDKFVSIYGVKKELF